MSDPATVPEPVPAKEFIYNVTLAPEPVFQGPELNVKALASTIGDAIVVAETRFPLREVVRVALVGPA